MDPFWNNIYDDEKDKRYGGLFFAVLIFFFVGLPLIAWLCSVCDIVPNLTYPDLSRFQVVCLIVTGGLGLVAIVLLLRRWVRIGRKTRQDRLKYSDLSRDELMKARSKLRKNMNPVKFRAVERPGKRPALRAPDTDLKY